MILSAKIKKIMTASKFAALVGPNESTVGETMSFEKFVDYSVGGTCCW